MDSMSTILIREVLEQPHFAVADGYVNSKEEENDACKITDMVPTDTVATHSLDAIPGSTPTIFSA